MAAAHPLDLAAWSALNGTHAAFSLAEGGARRYHPDFGVFAALADRSEASLAGLEALVRVHGDVALLEPGPPPVAPGLAVVSQDVGLQMVFAGRGNRVAPDLDMAPLGEEDAPAMLALARRTEPGPFFSRTHQLGDFFGVKSEGRLVAMAGERMKPAGFTEVSGVCTDPDYRGRGYAGALMRLVADRIFARGETPFLHAYASNRDAIALYERLGFVVRREVLMTRLTQA